MWSQFGILILASLVYSAHIVPLKENQLSPAQHLENLEYMRHHSRTLLGAGLGATLDEPTLLPARNYLNIRYSIEMTIGSPPQLFTVLPDTGSSDLWVYSSRCWWTWACWKYDAYYSFWSKTSSKNGTNVQVHYGSGSIKGFMTKDTCSVGGYEAKDFQFTQVTSADGSAFNTADFSGILGLAWESISSYNVPVWFSAMVEQNEEVQNAFSFFLSNNEATPSYFILGGEDDRFYEGRIKYHKLTHKLYWVLKGTGFKIDGGRKNKDQIPFVVDTGTSLIIGPPEFLDNIGSKLTVAEDCSNLDTLPTVHFYIDGRDYPLKPEEYVIRVNYMGSEFCLMGIWEMDKYPFVILGDVFLHTYYSVFDMEKERVGFARAKVEIEI